MYPKAIEVLKTRLKEVSIALEKAQSKPDKTDELQKAANCLRTQHDMSDLKSQKETLTSAIQIMENSIADCKTSVAAIIKELREEKGDLEKAIGFLEKTCCNCEGAGTVTTLDAAGSRDHVKCPSCKGKGRLYK